MLDEQSQPEFHPMNILSPTVVVLFARAPRPSYCPDIGSPRLIQPVIMEDYDVDMDEEKEGDVLMREATAGHWWEDCEDEGTQNHRGGRGFMVNSRSWAEELKDIFVPQAEKCYSGGQSTVSSISVSNTLSFSVWKTQGLNHSL